MTSERLPNFIAVGPPRTATTWLHTLLRRRANLPERSKETRFFDNRFRLGLDWYARHFQHARPGVPTGEIAPTYFHSACARERIADLLPGVKIIESLREPVERLYSLYRLKLSAGLLRGSFLEALHNDPEMIESSRYAFHLPEWMKLFGPERVMVLVYEDLLREPVQYAEQIFDYLGLPQQNLLAGDFTPVHNSETFRQPRHPMMKRLSVQLRDSILAHGVKIPRRLMRRVRFGKLVERMVERSSRAIPPLDPDLEARLREQFRSEVEGVERLLARELSIWRTPRIERSASQP